MCLFNRYDNTLICPYCFEEFSSDKVHFRASSKSPLPKVPDSLLNDWRKSFEMDPLGDDGVVINPLTDKVTESQPETFVTPDGKKRKLLTEIRDKHGVPTTTRLCPHCHNVLPKHYGKGESKVLAVLGDTYSGKTVYIIALIDWLRENFHTYFTDGYAAVCVGEKQYLENKAQLDAMNSGGMASTMPKFQEPYIIEILYKKKALYLSIFDFPGEADQKRFEDVFIRQATKADGLLLTYDLCRSRTFKAAVISYYSKLIEAIPSDSNQRALLKKAELEIIKTKIETKGSEFDSWTTSILGNCVSTRQKRPCAVVWTKSDVIRSLTYAEEFPYELQALKDDIRVKFGGTQLDTSNLMSRQHTLLLDMLRMKDGGIINMLQSANYNFDAMHFAVSSLGGDLGAGHDNRESINIENPILWLMRKFRFI